MENENLDLLEQETAKVSSVESINFDVEPEDFEAEIDTDENFLDEESEENGQDSDEQSEAEPSEKPKKRIQKEGEGRQVYEKAAKQTVTIYDAVMSKICMAIAQADTDEKYRLTPAERRDLINVTADFIEIKGDFLTPEQKFYSFVATMVSVSIITAISDRQKKKRARVVAKEITQKTDVESPSFEFAFEDGYTGERKQFQVHPTTGCYQVTTGGSYMKVKESTVKAPDWIVSEYMDKVKRQHWSHGRFNQHIIEILDEMVKSGKDVSV